MGQYSQWLHYREVDRQLQARLETLASELAQLQDRARLFEQNGQGQKSCVSADNQIIHALRTMHTINAQAASQNGRASSIDSTSGSPRTPVPPSLTEITPPATAATASPALFAWNNLPNAGPQAVSAETPEAPASVIHPQEGATKQSAVHPALSSPTRDSLHHAPRAPRDEPLPRVPHHELTLLPEDMDAFIDEHAMTDPQIELPWWLRKIAVAPNAAHSANGPIDQESLRTNRLVQRWLERWGRQNASRQQQPWEARGSGDDE